MAYVFAAVAFMAGFALVGTLLGRDFMLPCGALGAAAAFWIFNARYSPSTMVQSGGVIREARPGVLDRLWVIAPAIFFSVASVALFFQQGKESYETWRNTPSRADIEHHAAAIQEKALAAMTAPAESPASGTGWLSQKIATVLLADLQRVLPGSESAGRVFAHMTATHVLVVLHVPRFSVLEADEEAKFSKNMLGVVQGRLKQVRGTGQSYVTLLIHEESGFHMPLSGLFLDSRSDATTSSELEKLIAVKPGPDCVRQIVLLMGKAPEADFDGDNVGDYDAVFALSALQKVPRIPAP